MSRVTDFDVALRAAGIPIRGVNSSGVNAEINFDPTATAQQRTQAANLAASFDWTERRTRDLQAVHDDLVTWLSGLTAAQQRNFIAWVAVLAFTQSGQLDRLKNLTNIDPTEPVP
jgi:hypothetical protein